ncbi:OmpH family outer membrane protein [Glacieibacterium frigidum]|uniref:OmpH family outer membrane protein n=1 Tax=Glacieibacterium frigidum TaxID=2593303 RepID=A0A552UIN9_9SPHN|nr:OmpH family outer membrane protein [Glacieibacterium frigidum]TRW18060.1 OmpH family outer membrane protein [Glacieibacterium frigidum]
MTNMFKSLALATTLLATPLMAQTLPAPVIVIVDMEEIISTSVAGKQAQNELKTRFDGIQARLQSLRTQYGTEEQALLKTRPTAPGAAATAWETKAREMQTRKTKDEQDLAKRNQDFEAARQNVLRQINEGAQPIISTVMRERGASIVLAEGATLQHTAALDVTKDVVARLDKALPRVSAAPPAAAPAAK